MLRTDDRLLLSEALAPPPGHQADLLVGTTYSLHLSALLSVPLALTFADWESDDGSPSADPVAALEAVRRYAARITIFCQAGATAATDQPPLVASWLEDVVVPVAAPADAAVFHPKVWVARYRDVTSGHARYRVLCGSRNLTFDRSWDTVLVLDGEPARRGKEPASGPLADFLAALPGLATGTPNAGRVAEIRALGEELRRVRFTAPTPFEDVTFHPLGIEGHRSDPMAAEQPGRRLIVAPFVGRKRLTRLATTRQPSILVSRSEELERLPTAKLRSFGQICSLDDATSPPEASEDSAALSGLHAKLFVAEHGARVSVWTGSANATSAAFERNVEFLVRLDGPRPRCGIDAILGRADDDTSLASMLVEVERREEGAEPDARVELERELDTLAHRLAERRIVASVSPAGAGGGHDVELRANEPPAWPDGFEVRCWPLTGLADRDAAAVQPGAKLLARFAGQGLAYVTAFFTFELVGHREAITVTKQMLVRADLEGVPEGRSAAIMQELLRDPAQVMRLLRALLEFDAAREPGGGVGAIADLDGRSGSTARTEAPLLESLLRALHDAPEKLDAVARLVEDFAELEDVLPPEFLEIWRPIHAVHAGAKR